MSSSFLFPADMKFRMRFSIELGHSCEKPSAMAGQRYNNRTVRRLIIEG